MDVKAQAKYIKMSPRKLRLVIDLVRDLSVEEALDRLALTDKRAVAPVRKLLQSALANAENNFKLKKQDLLVKTIMVDNGPVLKRWRARAFGRAALIRKPTSHVTVVLTDGQATTVKPETVAKPATKNNSPTAEIAKTKAKTEKKPFRPAQSEKSQTKPALAKVKKVATFTPANPKQTNK